MASAPSLDLARSVRRTARAATGRVRGRARFQPAGEWAGRILALALLLLFLPVLAAAAVSIALLCGATPLIAHRRVGLYGEEFWMLKLRTMWDRSPRRRAAWQWIEYLPENHVPVFKGSADPRVTSALARFYRRFSIDELPQLLHVITGRMRLVGPRPITFAEWDRYYGDSAAEVLTVAPGITGLWQVLGRNRLTYAQRRRLDLFYARRRGLRLNWLILTRTPARVVSGRDAG